MQLRITNPMLLGLGALFLTVIVLLFAFSPKVSAEEIGPEVEPLESEAWIPMLDSETIIEVDAPYTYTEPDGSVTFFDNEEDYNAYIESKQLIRANASYEKIKSTLLKETKLSKRWIGYHKYTPSWNKATGYTLSSGSSYQISGTVTYEGYSTSVTVNQNNSASVSFYADKNKWSRLGVRHDMNYRKWKHQVIDATGKVKRTYYTQHLTKTGVPYISVVYQ